MRRIKYFLLSVLIIGTCFHLNAQFDNVKFDRVSAQYGLPNGYIKDIIEDQYGFLWFGTREGIFRYDGYEFKAYRHDIQDSTSLSHPNVNVLFEDKNGNLWIGTNNGLSLLDRRTGKFQNFRPTPKNKLRANLSDNVNKIIEDKNGNFWLGLSRNMIYFEPEKGAFNSPTQKDDPQTSFSISSYFEDSQENIWAATTTGLLKYNLGDTIFQNVFTDPSMKDVYKQYMVGIQEAKDGTYWIATKKDLIHWNPLTNEMDKVFMSHAQPDASISYLTVDKQGNPWVAIAKNGLGVYDIKQKQFHHFSHKSNQINSLNHNSVTCILEDQFRNIWVGTANGISKIRLDESGFKLLQNEGTSGNISNNITRVLKDRIGTVWTKTSGGIYQIIPGHEYGEKLEEFTGETTSLGWDSFLEDIEGGIWLSVSRNGIYRRAPGSELFKKMNFGDTLSQAGIYKMIFDTEDKNIIWIGTTIGLCRLNWKTSEKSWYRPMDQLPQVASNRFTIFEQYGNDEIWVYYTYSSCLGRFKKSTGEFNVFFPPPEKEFVLKGIIKDIVIGKDGNLWLASLFGLVNFNINNEKFSIFGKKDGMLENELQSILIDQKDNVWVIGHRFFARFDQKDTTFYNYQNSKTIQNFQARSRQLAEDGSISLGSINGVYTFHPDRINKNLKAPDIVLTDFKVKNESFGLSQAIENTKEITLSFDENDVAFEFSGLHYINPSANEYRCKLVGYDDEWRELGQEHKMSYTNLNHGQYTFLATAANGDGVWNTEGLSIQLLITPAFWQTMWFKSLIFLVLLSISYALYKNRQHQLILKRHKELAEQSAEYKTRFLADVSHEIRTPMNAIIGLSKLTLDTKLNQKQTKYVGAIQESSKNLLMIINDLLDHTKLEAGKFTFVKKEFELFRIINQLKNTLSHIAAEKNLGFEVQINQGLPQKFIGDPIRLNQILTNLLGNALKFTNTGKVWLHINKMQESHNSVKLRFEIGDTGVGIPQDKIEFIFESFNQSEAGINKGMEGTGLGLSIAKQLIEKQGGHLFVESELGKGSRLWFDLIFENASTTSTQKTDNNTTPKIEKLKVLVVEDTYFNQMLIVELLKKNIKHPEIAVAENGEIALEKIKKQSFDILLMDIKMPVMNGFEATIKIRQLPDTKLNRIPILAVTASAVPEQLQKCTEAGMNDYVTKPIDEKELMRKIHLLTQNTEDD